MAAAGLLVGGVLPKEATMSRPIDDILHYFKSRGIDLLESSTYPRKLIADHWADMSEDAGLKAHGELAGSIAAALASELVYAERELIACDEQIRHLRKIYRKLSEQSETA